MCKPCRIVEYRAQVRPGDPFSNRALNTAYIQWLKCEVVRGTLSPHLLWSGPTRREYEATQLNLGPIPSSALQFCSISAGKIRVNGNKMFFFISKAYF